MSDFAGFDKLPLSGQVDSRKGFFSAGTGQRPGSDWHYQSE